MRSSKGTNRIKRRYGYALHESKSVIGARESAVKSAEELKAGSRKHNGDNTMNTATIGSSQARVKDAVVSWLQDILDRTEWSATHLSNKANVSPSTTLRILKKKNDFVPSFKTLAKLSAAANARIPRDILDAFEMSNVEEGDEKMPVRQSVLRALESLEDEEIGAQLTIPLKPVSAFPRGMAMAKTTRLGRERVRCPPVLEDDRTAFAFQMPDDSLSPWIIRGALLYATEEGEPKVGDLILLTSADGRSKVRMVSEVDETGLVLSRPTPFGDEEHVSHEDAHYMAIIKVIDRP
ncbi:hypothetical protein [Methylobacterium indicum]|uniref:Uncharacterized protein n=1 Tax=Methylobacterium indicum TaxID=1775910 RepID=A0A8H8X013_9HYPH|nr:hypothetical protein [Methylobacterium indicum]BCM87835.1 hypothetical protein mvi_62960 [Methylobacterium indicum]